MDLISTLTNTHAIYSNGGRYRFANQAPAAGRLPSCIQKWRYPGTPRLKFVSPRPALSDARSPHATLSTAFRVAAANRLD